MAIHKFPKSIGEAIDLLYQMRTDRLALQKQVDEAQATETALKQHILTNFAKADLEGAKGQVATASIKRTTQANVVDWEAFHTFIGKKKAWDLLQKRPSITALRERWDHNEEIPGVESFETIDISLTKASR